MRACFSCVIVSLVSGPAIACDGVRDSDYRGEVIATLHGTVTARSETVVFPDDAGVAVVWEMMNPVGGLQFMDFTEVTGGFPSAFRLDLRRPPDQGLLVDMPDGNAVALGRLYLSTELGQNPIVNEDGSLTWGYWSCIPGTVIAYLREDVAAGSASADYFGCGLDSAGSDSCAGLTAGYHVMDVEAPPYEYEFCRRDAAPGDDDYCEPQDVRLAAQDLETELNIVVPDICDGVIYRNPVTGW